MNKKLKKLTARVTELEQQLAEVEGAPGPPSGPAGGDITGSYPNPSIAGNAVNGPKVADNSLTGADVKDLTGADVTNDSLTGTDVAGLGAGDITDLPAVRAQSPSESSNTDQVLNSGDVPEALQFDEELYDADAMHQSGQYDVDGTYFAAPRAGVYEISAGVILSDPGSNYGTKRQLYLTRDPDVNSSGGEAYVAGQIVAPQNPGATVMNASGVVHLNQGDVVQAWVSHNATSNLVTALSQVGLIGDGRSFLSMTWIGPA